MPINKEFGQDMSGAPDPLTPQQRSLLRQRDKARALARAWDEVADNYQAAFAATKHDDERNARLFIADARNAQESAKSLPTPDNGKEG